MTMPTLLSRFRVTVPTRGEDHVMYAIVRGGRAEALAELRRDDPLWERDDVEFLGVHRGPDVWGGWKLVCQPASAPLPQGFAR